MLWCWPLSLSARPPRLALRPRPPPLVLDFLRSDMAPREDGVHSNPALTLLQVYYPVVSTLHAYLHDILDSQEPDFQMVRDDDASRYQTLLETSYVASIVPSTDLKRFTPTPPMAHIQEVCNNNNSTQCTRTALTYQQVIDRAQERLFLKARNGKPCNIITAGYRKVNQQDSRTKIGASRVPLTNYFVNTMVTALQAQEWDTLLQRFIIRLSVVSSHL